MEQINDPSASCYVLSDKEMEAVDLLEDCWFFHNLFNTKPRMTRCYSDPCPSMPRCFATPTSKELAGANASNSTSPNLIRTPSMPPCRVREKEEKGSNFPSNGILSTQPSDPTCVQEEDKAQWSNVKLLHREDCNSRRSKLLRTPSLPPNIGRQEIDPTAIRSTRHASPNHSDIAPPRHNLKSCSIPRSRPPTSMNIDSIKEMRRRFLHLTKTRRSLSELEFEEVQGFKDLGFSFEKEVINTRVVNILPGLQDKKRGEPEQDKAMRRPYLSEAWLVQPCAPPVPYCASKRSSADMKAQIKFWARAVASNVRQEC